MGGGKEGARGAQAHRPDDEGARRGATDAGAAAVAGVGRRSEKDG